MNSKNDTPLPPEEALFLPVENRVFYRGTEKRTARRVVHEGFKDWSYATPADWRHPYRNGRFKKVHDRHLKDGSFGRGTYITCNWRAALFFGPVIFRVELRPGTRLIRMDVPPVSKTIDSLRREFGREVLVKNPLKVMPQNKRLTLNEAIQLARYHYHGRLSTFSNNQNKNQNHNLRMRDLRSILVRYGIHGWGEGTDLDGIVVFALDRVIPKEVFVPIGIQNRMSFDEANHNPPHSQLVANSLKLEQATTPSADNTRRWLKESNKILSERS
jgi:hypothetical protein